MELIVKYKGLKLIKKYYYYYIRFIGGQYEEYPCDLRITNKEALEIISKNEEIANIRNSYMKQVKWTKKHFVDSGISDFLFYECDLDNNDVEQTFDRFNRHQDIKLEFYETIMYGDFPKSGAVIVYGFTAKKIKEAYNTTVKEAYENLVFLREEPQKALALLKKTND